MELLQKIIPNLFYNSSASEKIVSGWKKDFNGHSITPFICLGISKNKEMPIATQLDLPDLSVLLEKLIINLSIGSEIPFVVENIKQKLQFNLANNLLIFSDYEATMKTKKATPAVLVGLDNDGRFSVAAQLMPDDFLQLVRMVHRGTKQGLQVQLTGK